jgi:hypothetical protein
VFLVLIFASVSLGGHILQLQQDLDKLFQSNPGFRLEEMGKDDAAVWNQQNANMVVQNNPAFTPLESTLESVEFNPDTETKRGLVSAIIAYIFAGWGFPQNEEVLNKLEASGNLIDRLQAAHVLLKSLNSGQVSALEVFSMLLAIILLEVSDWGVENTQLAIVLPNDIVFFQVPIFEGAADAALVTLVNENKAIWKAASDVRNRDTWKVDATARPPPRQLIMKLAAVPSSIRLNGVSSVFINIVVLALQQYQPGGERNPVWSEYNDNFAKEKIRQAKKEEARRAKAEKESIRKSTKENDRPVTQATRNQYWTVMAGVSESLAKKEADGKYVPDGDD